MGLLKFYYDEIILNNFNKSLERDFLLNDYDPDTHKIDETEFYRAVSQEIMEKFRILYEKELRDQIWKVIRSLRRIILKPDEIKSQFEKLLEINKTLPEQRSPEWYVFRENLITASSWGNVLGYIGSPKEVILQKCGHEPSQFKGNVHTVWGTKYEPVAGAIYEYRMGKKVIDFGCLRHPMDENFFLGASPDGISDDGVMLEIKCPPRRIIEKIPTNYYWAQMQGQLEVCDLERCDFLECKIAEYDDEESYLDDINCAGDRPHTDSYGMESGVIMNFKKDGDLKYFYSELFLRGKDLTEWQVKIMKENRKMEFIGATYWKLTEYHCKPVFRDREWFQWAREQLKLFYDQWQFYKKHGYESLLTERQIKPRSSGVEDTLLTEYAGFTVTSEAGEETEVVVRKLKKFGFSSSKEPDGVPEKKFSFNLKQNESVVEKISKKFGFSSEPVTPKSPVLLVEEEEVVKPPKKFGFSFS